MKKTSYISNIARRVLSRENASLTSTIPINEHKKVLPFSSIPSPPSYPLLGHLHLFAKKKNQDNMDKFLESLMKEYGDIVRLKVSYSETDHQFRGSSI